MIVPPYCPRCKIPHLSEAAFFYIATLTHGDNLLKKYSLAHGGITL